MPNNATYTRFLWMCNYYISQVYNISALSCPLLNLYSIDRLFIEPFPCNALKESMDMLLFIYSLKGRSLRIKAILCVLLQSSVKM